jgi:adenosylcobinamide kinase / adenosylcobinamide-phosphate guanylyltransferase
MNTAQEFNGPLLVLGAAKSGKSAYAEAILNRFSPPLIYIATAQVLDNEMKERVNAHKERRKDRWDTIECPLLLPDTLNEVCRTGRPVLIDCITLWLSNLLCFSSIDPGTAVEELCRSILAAPNPLVIVSNEVGGGIVPENELARKFRDLAGTANQMLARTCASVVLVVAGLPLTLK